MTDSFSSSEIHENFEKKTHFSCFRPLLLFSLFLVARARSFFWKYKKKKKKLRNRPSCCPPTPGHARLCLQVAWLDDWKPQSRRESRESHFRAVAWTTKTVKGSFFKLQSSWGRSIKTEKDGLRDPLVCVGIFQAFDVRFNAPSSTKAGPIDDHSADFAPFAASSANTREA